MATRHLTSRSHSSAAGYSLVEMLVSMAVLTVVMGATMLGLSNATRAYNSVVGVGAMNGFVRAGMDILVRDMLQVGSGLPPGHVIEIPHGSGATPVRLPGPPGTAFTLASGSIDIDAVVPSPGAGPVINGTPTDVVSVLMADNTFLDLPLTAITATTITVSAGPDMANGPDRVSEGQLMMVSKGSQTALLQVTSVNAASRTLTFSNGDSLNLNQSGAADGTLAALNAADPANAPAVTRVSRIRMITYYIDNTTDPKHPRLVRRVNNGHPTVFDNTLGNTVAFDVENLQFAYDIVNGTTNPSNVKMTLADRGLTGRCAPLACSETQIRKVNVAMTGRSKDTGKSDKVFRNTLTSQVSFRGMAFVDEYLAP